MNKVEFTEESNMDISEIICTEEESQIDYKEANPINIMTATPLLIQYKDQNKHDNYVVANITFLCTDDSNSIFTLSRNFIIDDINELNYLESIPLYEENNFISTKIAAYYINKNNLSYITDFNFTVAPNYDKVKNPKVNFVGFEIINEDNVLRKGERKIFTVSPDIFACISFIESYIHECITNEYDLTMATVGGSKIVENSEFFVINDIVDIISLAPADKELTFKEKISSIFKKKELSTSIALVAKVMRYSDAGPEILSLLIPFNIGIRLPKEKFKSGDTVKEIQDKYFGDSDQYISTFIVSKVRFKGIDKEFMVVRGKNKDNNFKIFLIDSSIKTKLIKMIEEY